MTTVLSTVDSSPKWFTEVVLEGSARSNDAALHFVPRIEYSDAPFTRVQFDEVDPRVTPEPTPA